MQRFELSDELWMRLEPLLPKVRKRARWRGGRPQIDARVVANAIFFVLRTGCQWKAITCEGHGCSGSTAHRYFQRWERAGVFRRFWASGLSEYEELEGIQWDFQSMDGAMVKAPLGGGATGPNPTDRAKSGTKRSLQTDGAGIPVGVVIDGANRHDKKLVSATIESIPVERPRSTRRKKQGMCMDKGYDYEDTREMLVELGYTPHVRSRGEERIDRSQIPGCGSIAASAST
jgi:putative transposase